MSNTVEVNWSSTAGLSFTQSISYGTKFLGGETSLTFSRKFQQGGSKSESVTVGQQADVMVDLDPGEAVLAEFALRSGQS